MNAAMLLLVASSLTPAEPATPAVPTFAFAPSVVATFAKPDPTLAALPAATPPEKNMQIFAGGGAWLHPGQYPLFGGGVMFKPMKDKPEIALQADVYLGWSSHTEFVEAGAIEGSGETVTSTSLFALISFNLLYQLPIMKTSTWKTHIGGGVMIDKGSGYTDAFFDIKVLFTHMMGNKVLRPEIRFGIASSVAIIALFSLGF